MKILHGCTTIKCYKCGAVAVMDSKDVGAMTEYACPSCGTNMPEGELVRLKLHLYVSLSNVYRVFCHNMKNRFLYSFNPHPHPIADVEKLEENGNREGG